MSDEAVKVAVTEENATASQPPEETKQQEARPAETPPLAPREWWPFENLRREAERAFEEFYRGPWRLPFTRTAFDLGPVWPGEAFWGAMPAADIVETAGGYVISVEMPGVSAGNVEVRLADERLCVKGEKKEQADVDRKGLHISERRYGALQRSFRVPDGVDRNKIEATFANGVLTVTLPKAAEAVMHERVIDVKAA
jgi:HSP20 family protein